MSGRATTIAIVSGLAAFGVCAYVMMRPDEGEWSAQVLPESNPVASRESSSERPSVQVGLAVDEQGVFVQSWPEWMEFAPEAFERAIADGALGAENVLLHVLQRALPRMKWPPEEGTQPAEQYASLIKVVAEFLTLEPEPDSPRLRVIT